MNHYIVANCHGTDVEFHPGIQETALKALADSGFDLYRGYGASRNPLGQNETDDGGQSQMVGREQARQVLVGAVAWAVALKEAMPGVFREAWEEAPGHSQTFAEQYESAGVGQIPFPLHLALQDRYETVARALELLGKLNLDIAAVEPALQYVKFVLSFTFQVHEATSQGPVEISFC